jgi:hypothetical protein
MQQDFQKAHAAGLSEPIKVVGLLEELGLEFNVRA